MRRDITEDQIIRAATSAASMHEAAKSLNIPFGTFKDRAKKLGVYKTNQGRKGVGRTPGQIAAAKQRRKDLADYVGHSGLKYILIKDGILKYRCDECGIEDWQGKPITLQLDHKDGDPANNQLDNLHLLCPNCHTQTPTWGRKNRQRIGR